MTVEHSPDTPAIRRRLRRPLRALLTAVVLGVVLPGAAGLAPATAAGTNAWSSATAGPGNTTYNPGESAVTAATAARVQQAWSAKQQMGSHTAPTVVNGVVYYVDNATDGSSVTRLVAASARTGGRLWSLMLPPDQSYPNGMSVVGDVAVLAYQGWTQRAGVTAVNLRTHRLMWNKALPPLPASYSWLAPWLPGEVVADATRVYISGGSTNPTAFRLSDGALLWSQPISIPLAATSLAVSNGVLYGGNGQYADRAALTAYSAATGTKLWTAPGGGLPVVAGGRVFSPTATGITAVAAGGCGASVCPALWTRVIRDLRQWSLAIGGADGKTLFAVWGSNSADKATMSRLSATTGAVLWSAPLGLSVVGTPVRGVDLVWVLTVAPDTNPADGYTYRLQAYPATGSSRLPLRTIDQAPGLGNSDEDIAVAAGTVFVQAWPQTLTAYRVAGT